MKRIDMSDKAITRRLQQTDQLRELSLSLIKAEKEADVKVAPEKSDGGKTRTANQK